MTCQQICIQFWSTFVIIYAYYILIIYALILGHRSMHFLHAVGCVSLALFQHLFLITSVACVCCTFGSQDPNEWNNKEELQLGTSHIHGRYEEKRKRGRNNIIPSAILPEIFQCLQLKTIFCQKAFCHRVNNLEPSACQMIIGKISYPLFVST